MLNPIPWDSKYRFYVLQGTEISLQVLVPAGKPETLTAGKSPPDHVPGRLVEANEVHGLMDIEEPEPCGLFTAWRKQGDLNC